MVCPERKGMVERSKGNSFSGKSFSSDLNLYLACPTLGVHGEHLAKLIQFKIRLDKIYTIKYTLKQM